MLSFMLRLERGAPLLGSFVARLAAIPDRAVRTWQKGDRSYALLFSNVDKSFVWLQRSSPIATIVQPAALVAEQHIRDLRWLTL